MILSENILITGGSGLLGSSIPFGHKPSSKEVNLLKDGDLESYLTKHPKIDTIIHAAGLVGGVQKNNDLNYNFFSQNLRMALNVMDVIASSNKIQNATFILSTCIFPEKVNYPVDVDSLHSGSPHPTNFGYAYAKRMLEVGAKALKQQYNKNISCLIPCNLYGPNDNYSLYGGHVIPSLIHKCYLAKQNNTAFSVWGSGLAQREFIFAPDFEKIMKSIHIDKVKIDDIMIVSSAEEYTIKEVVDLIVKYMNFNGEIIFDTSKPEGIMRKPTINDKFIHFVKNTGINLTSLSDGLKITVEHFMENYSSVKK